MVFLIILAFVLIIVLYLYVEILVPFNERRKYIKLEINRSCSEQEYNHWKKEMKKLYRKYIPLIGWFLK